MSEQARDALPRPWRMRQLETLARASRPLRRRLAPARFKETYVNRALDRLGRPSVYVEIGVRDGASFRIARATRKVGIDPERTTSMATLAPGEEFYEMTSDAFFAEHADSVLAGGVDVALVDGLHEFRQTLRDVVHLERFMRADGVIVIDDCNPSSADRASEVAIGGAWNGDVWKVVACFVAERPDLTVATLNADEGVGVITGFGTPRELDGATVNRYKGLPYEHLADDRERVLNLVPPSQFDELLGSA